ncbi:lysophospholipid acyltransferase family protein [Synechococcus sp. GFB01]|uniref:lysophospholipid acyltransferase family protein n=1 Tax=Synechococcus sp. GFB01 TaxID=1662190 RepID=UPI00064FACA6|nr:lysophospholipid acyltransferase family protein [Synechococcus sp. GFB01]KMM16897.1 hypothetical protein SYNGFB01_07830 [Synechococcus sp. GFB01]
MADRPGRRKRRRKWQRRLRRQVQTLAVQVGLLALRHRRHAVMQWLIRVAVRLGAPLFGRQFKLGERNLERVYGPTLSPRQRHRLIQQAVEHFLLACLESILRPVDHRVRFEGEGVAGLVERSPGQGAIVASLHLGCWDVALRWLSQQRSDVAVVYRSWSNPEADRLLNQARSANSFCHWISKTDTRAMLGWLRRGGTLVVMADLHGQHNPVDVTFLGLATRLSAGPFRLAQKTGCPIFPAAHVRDDDGCFLVHVGAPLAAGVDDLERLAQALCDWQEPWIHDYAEQYLWTYRHWRRQEGRRLRPLRPPGARVLAGLGP